MSGERGISAVRRSVVGVMRLYLRQFAASLIQNGQKLQCLVHGDDVHVLAGRGYHVRAVPGRDRVQELHVGNPGVRTEDRQLHGALFAERGQDDLSADVRVRRRHRLRRNHRAGERVPHVLA